MSTELTLSILGLLMSTLVAYHIAVRQGAFARTRLHVSLGDQILEHPHASRQPWAVFLGIPNGTERLYAVELPILLECDHHPIRKALLQIGYPRGRHATTHLQLKPAKPESGDTFRLVELPEWTLVEFGFEVLRPKTKTLTADLVTYRPSELREAIFESSSGLPPPVIRYVADAVTLFIAAENLPEFRQQCWLVAVIAESLEDLQQKASFISDALLRRDGVPLKAKPPGTRVFYMRRRKRRVVLTALKFHDSEDGVRYDRISSGSREIATIEVLPIVNSESPRIALGVAPNTRPQPDRNRASHGPAG